MILSLTTEYEWGPKELESLWLSGKRYCNGYKVMKSLDEKFKLNYYELTCWLPESSIEGVKRFISENKSKKISSVHAFAPLRKDFVIGNHPSDYYNLSSCKENTRKLAIKELNSTIKLSSELGAKYVVVHAGFKERNKQRKENLDSLLISLEEAVSFIEQNKYDVRIGVETALYPSQIFTNIDEIRACQNLYPKVGLWLDIGHCFVNKSSDLYKIAEDCHDLIIGMHLHNNDGKKDLHAAIDRGKINVKKIIEPLKEKIKREEIALILELYNYRSNSTPEDVKRSINLLEEIISSN